mmetsp:Transcript_30702/g.31925  ORF Transcript_30702/g.31925 Transcript_30702/m.31925 type:complete len:136 (-) Transcript_30702:107-514(-)
MLTYRERFTYYKSIAESEPKTWTRTHFCIRVYTNSFCAILFGYHCLKSFVFKYHIDKRVYNKQHYLGLAKRFIPVVAVIGVLEYCNYFLLDDHIYQNYYSELTDDQLIQLYEGTAGRKLMEKEMNNFLEGKSFAK